MDEYDSMVLDSPLISGFSFLVLQLQKQKTLLRFKIKHMNDFGQKIKEHIV